MIMGSDGKSRRTRDRPGGSLVLGTVLASLTLVGGCTYVPDALNPVEWYKSTTDFFTEDEEAQAAAPGDGQQPGALVAGRDTPPPGADQPFPTLAEVPDGLVSDSQGRRYSDQVISRQGAPTQGVASAGEPVAPAPPPLPGVAPAPAPMPSVAVAPAPAPAPALTQEPIVPKPAPSTIELTQPPVLQETYQAGLAQQLPVAGAPLSAFPLPAGPQELATVVISSEGVEVGGIPYDLGGVPQMVLPPAAAGSPAPSMPGPLAALPGPSFGVLKVATIQFPNGSAHLSPLDRGILGDVFRLHRQRGGKLHVVGHASSRTRNLDPISHKMANYGVSVARADAVVGELVRLGVRPGDIVVDAKSDSMPLYYEFMPSGEAGNRRTEIYLEG